MAVARYYDHGRGEWVLLAAGRDGTPGVSSWDDLADKPSTYPPASHTHPEYAESSRVAALEGNAPIIVSSLPASPLPGRIYLVTE